MTEFARRYGLLAAWAIIVIVFGVLRPDTYLTTGNFETIFGSQAVLVILTCGLIIPMAAGEFDLSVAGVMGIAVVLVGHLNIDLHWPIGYAISTAFGVGIAVGLTNAFFIVGLGLDSIVVTLGMNTLLVGVGYGISDLTLTGVAPSLVTATGYNVFGLPLIFYYALALTILLWYVATYTPLGRYVYFVGSGRDVARLSGVPVDLVRAGSLIAASLISVLAGIALVGYVGGSDPTVGADYLLPAFAAAFLGATAITPGRFNPWGSFIAAYFLVSGITGLEFLGLAGWIEQVFYGAALILAVTFSHLASRQGRR